MDVAVEKNTIDIDLDSPAVNFVGFEHEPGDAKEKATLDKAVADLKHVGALIAFTPAAQCTQKRVRVTSSLLGEGEDAGHDDHDHEEHADHHHDDEAVHGHDHHDEGDSDEHDHADINATWEVTCARPENLREIDFSGLFGRFAGTHSLRIQAALPNGQTSTELTPDSPRLKW
ncbi:MAG: DUF2796 domain-containing protein [Gammaproteobacteria bacterium]|nr:DUF2796 domain-containing protein [Gammaproteobacteria bacterium]